MLMWLLGLFVVARAASTAPYSYSLTTFDPTGRLQQLEFAFRAVERGSPAAGIVTPEGVVVATWSSSTHVHAVRVTDTIVVVGAGLEADVKGLVTHAIKLAVDYEREFGVPPTVASLASDLGGIVQEHTQVGGLRPFGVSLLVAGYDEDYDAFGLVQIDPSGWTAPWRATAVGKQSSELKEKLVLESDTIDKAVALIRQISPDPTLLCAIGVVRRDRATTYPSIDAYFR